MTTITSTNTAVQAPIDDAAFDESQLAAASFLARYSGRTLEAYRQDLRGFFQWAADHDVPVLAATRPHIELWRGSMEERGLAASTIRSEEHTSELQSLMRNSYAVFCLTKKK